MSEIVSLSADRDEALRRAGLAMRAGDLIVTPTDTVYGIAADAFNRDATAAIFRVKNRPRALPLPILVSRPRQAWALSAGVPLEASELAAAFWPGALTLVLRQAPDLDWDLGDTDGSISLRMPAHDDLIALLEMVGPVAATSANIAGEPTPQTVEGVRLTFGDAVAVYLDGGAAPSEVGSTIVDLAGTEPLVVREGPISYGDIERVLGRAVARA